MRVTRIIVLGVTTLLIVVGIVVAATVVSVSAQTGADGGYICADFELPGATAEAIAEGLADPSKLDADDDGVACEGTPGEYRYRDEESTEENGTIPTPSRVETGGGYCATHVSC